MTKNELITTVRAKLGSSRAEAVETVEIVLSTIIEGAIADGKSAIPGLGKLVKVKTAERSGTMKGKDWIKEEGETFRIRLGKAGKELL